MLHHVRPGEGRAFVAPQRALLLRGPALSGLLEGALLGPKFGRLLGVEVGDEVA